MPFNPNQKPKLGQIIDDTVPGWKEALLKRTAPMMHKGGTVPKSGTYKLQKGERVVPWKGMSKHRPKSKGSFTPARESTHRKGGGETKKKKSAAPPSKPRRRG